MSHTELPKSYTGAVAETLARAGEELVLLSDVRAYAAALAQPHVRMLTDEEEGTLRMCCAGTWQGFACGIQRKFAKVNGLTLAVSPLPEP